MDDSCCQSYISVNMKLDCYLAFHEEESESESESDLLHDMTKQLVFKSWRLFLSYISRVCKVMALKFQYMYNNPI